MSLKLIAETKWLKFFTRTYQDKKELWRKWDFISRKDNPDNKTDRADAVVIVPFLEDGRMVLIKQFRPAINDYIIESVAGLIDPTDKDIDDAAIRELEEEVGLEITSYWGYNQKLYNSVGITDESCSYIFCKAKGEPSTEKNEDSEDIEIVIVNREEARELTFDVKQKISAKCWLVLMAYANGFDWYEDGGNKF
jgi:ADP-ribose pyrophosphatase